MTAIATRTCTDSGYASQTVATRQQTLVPSAVYLLGLVVRVLLGSAQANVGERSPNDRFATI